MDALEFLPAVGKTDATPEVSKLLQKLKATRRPQLKKDELYDYMNFPDQGVILVFRESDDPKTSEVVLSSAQFYSSAKAGFKGFSGKLPDGLQFVDTQKDVHKKLGKPKSSKKNLFKDFWERKGYVQTVQYDPKSGQIYMVNFSVPMD